MLYSSRLLTRWAALYQSRIHAQSASVELRPHSSHNACMESLLQDLDPKVGLGLLGATGLVYCFLGYRLFRCVLAFTGFALAGAVAAVGVGWLTFGATIPMVIALLAGGLCGAMALYFLYRTGVFFLGFLGALLVGYQVLHGRPETWAPWAIVGVAFAGGLLALALERPTMKLATAAIGAWLCTYAIAFMVWGEPAAERWMALPTVGNSELGMLALWAFLTLVGSVFQWQVFRSSRKQQEPA